MAPTLSLPVYVTSPGIPSALERIEDWDRDQQKSFEIPSASSATVMRLAETDVTCATSVVFGAPPRAWEVVHCSTAVATVHPLATAAHLERSEEHRPLSTAASSAHGPVRLCRYGCHIASHTLFAPTMTDRPRLCPRLQSPDIPKLDRSRNHSRLTNLLPRNDVASNRYRVGPVRSADAADTVVLVKRRPVGAKARRRSGGERRDPAAGHARATRVHPQRRAARVEGDVDDLWWGPDRDGDAVREVTVDVDQAGTGGQPGQSPK